MEIGLDNLFTIGETSGISGMSIRMLRHYDKIGLIKPEYVDPYNNYRYYSEEQILYLSFINELKTRGFKLKEIKTFFNMKTPEPLLDFFKSKIDEIENKEKKLAKSKARLNDFIEQLKIIKNQNPDKKEKEIINFAFHPERIIFSIKHEIEYTTKNFLKSFSQLQALIQKKSVKIKGPYMVIFHPEINELELQKSKGLFEFCVEVESSENIQENFLNIIPSGQYLNAFFHDIEPHFTTKKYYNELLKIIHENKYEIKFPLIKKYFHRKSLSKTNSSPLSEIQLLVCK